MACALLCGGCVNGATVYCISAIGLSLWGSGINLNEMAVFSGGLPAANGEVLLAWQLGNQIHVDRIDMEGQSVWTEQAIIETGNSSNMRVVGLESDEAEGAFVVWDHPGSHYTRIIKTSRISGDGNVVWGPIITAPVSPGSSRHTDPVAIMDGSGGVAVVWTEGTTETAETPVPLYVQRIDENGALLNAGLGARVLTSTQHQVDPIVVREPDSDDLLICWREGAFGPQSLRAQRMTIEGSGVWGDTGIHVAPTAVVPSICCMSHHLSKCLVFRCSS